MNAGQLRRALRQAQTPEELLGRLTALGLSLHTYEDPDSGTWSAWIDSPRGGGRGPSTVVGHGGDAEGALIEALTSLVLAALRPLVARVVGRAVRRLGALALARLAQKRGL